MARLVVFYLGFGMFLSLMFGWIRGQERRPFDAAEVIMALVWPLSLLGFVFYKLNVWGAAAGQKRQESISRWCDRRRP